MAVYLHFDSLARSDAFIRDRNNIILINTATTGPLSGTFGIPTVDDFTYTATGPQTIDGVPLTLGTTVLIKDEIPPVNNGLYVVTNDGSGGGNVVLSRLTGFQNGDILTQTVRVQIVPPNSNSVSNGVNHNNYFTLPLPPPITVGTDAINFETGSLWLANDYRLENTDLLTFSNGQFPETVQMPTRYRVFYRELNSCWDRPTIHYREHCKKFPENITYSLEFCTAILPSNTAVQVPEYDAENNIIGFTLRSILNEPYIYVRVRSSDYDTSDLFITNNKKAKEATFIVWHDKYNLGSTDTIIPNDPIDGGDTTDFPELDGRPRWIVFKSCMNTSMRLNMCSDMWEVRYFDRFGRDLILLEETPTALNPTVNPPPVDRYKQTSFVLGVRPNYT